MLNMTLTLSVFILFFFTFFLRRLLCINLLQIRNYDNVHANIPGHLSGHIYQVFRFHLYAANDCTCTSQVAMETLRE